MRSTRRRLLLATSAAFVLPRVAIARPVYPAERIAPMLMVGFDGASAAASGVRQMADHIAAGRVGGICFVAKNAVTRKGVESITASFHAASARRWHLLMAIDQEGGNVQRLSSHLGYGFEPSPTRVGNTQSADNARKTYAAMALEMRKTGFNLNLAPVVDLGFEPRNVLITQKGRTFGTDPESVIRYSRAFVAGHRDEGVLTALKHFPGHGSALRDSHEGAVDVTRTWREEELIPYTCLAAEGMADMIMTGHLSHLTLTDGLPASLSASAIEGMLRKRVKFGGVVITDDLDMKAVRRNFSRDEAVIRAAEAGNDVLLSTNDDSDPDLPMHMVLAVQKGIRDGRLSADRIEASVRRIEALKAGITARMRPRLAGRE
jgi:beta-N-acetylhexosaminidase